jgi:hypothetical protein
MQTKDEHEQRDRKPGESRCPQGKPPEVRANQDAGKSPAQPWIELGVNPPVRHRSGAGLRVDQGNVDLNDVGKVQYGTVRLPSALSS